MSDGPATPPEAPDDSAGSTPGTLQEVGRYGGHGLTIAAATALFTWLGNLLDRWLHTSPLFVIVGAFAGFGGGFYAMYRDLVLRPGAAHEEEARQGRGDEPRDGDGPGGP